MGKSYLCVLRAEIERQYLENPTHCGASFGEILCWEIHSAGLTFSQLSEKWGVSLPTLGELIWDHCKRLEEMPRVDHGFKADLDYIGKLPRKLTTAECPPRKREVPGSTPGWGSIIAAGLALWLAGVWLVRR